MFRVDPAVIQASAKARSDVYPYATWMPIKEASTQSKIIPRLLILHSQAGPAMTSLDALWKYVNRDDVHIEPTFILDFSGRMAQLVGILTRADCSASANPFSTAVETQDMGSAALAHTPWSPEQCEQLAGLAAFEHLHPGIRLSLVPATTWNGQGIGPHRQFPQWSVYVGKTCPGDARVAQIPGIIARAIEIADWQPEKPRPETPEVPEVPRPQPQPDPIQEDDDMHLGLFHINDVSDGTVMVGYCDANGDNALVLEHCSPRRYGLVEQSPKCVKVTKYGRVHMGAITCLGPVPPSMKATDFDRVVPS